MGLVRLNPSGRWRATESARASPLSQTGSRRARNPPAPLRGRSLWWRRLQTGAAERGAERTSGRHGNARPRGGRRGGGDGRRGRARGRRRDVPAPAGLSFPAEPGSVPETAARGLNGAASPVWSPGFGMRGACPRETEAGGSPRAPGQPGLRSRIRSQKTEARKRKLAHFKSEFC